MSPSLPLLKLRAWRTHRGLTQEQLAEAMGVTNSMISQLESGARRWNATHLVAAAAALECAPHQLLTTDPTKNGHEDIFADVPEEKRAEAERAVRALLKAYRRDEAE